MRQLFHFEYYLKSGALNRNIRYFEWMWSHHRDKLAIRGVHLKEMGEKRSDLRTGDFFKDFVIICVSFQKRKKNWKKEK